jgi:hypothetical protein
MKFLDAISKDPDINVEISDNKEAKSVVLLTVWHSPMVASIFPKNNRVNLASQGG